MRSLRNFGKLLACQFVPSLAAIGYLGWSLPHTRPAAWLAPVAAAASILVLGGAVGAWLAARWVDRAAPSADCGDRVEARLRAELATSEARFRAVFEHSPVCLNLKDAEGRYLLVNRPYEQWLGRPAAEIVGRTSREILWDSDREVEDLTALEQDVLRSGAVRSKEIDVLRGDRRHHRILIKFPVAGEDGRVAAVGTAAVDITARKEAEEAHRRDEERFRTALDSLADGVAYFDAEDRFVTANAEWLRSFQLDAGADLADWRYEDFVRRVLGLGLLDHEIGGADREAWLAARLRRRQNPTGAPIMRRYTDGATVMIRERRTPDGGIVQTRTDVTALQRAERRLAESEARFKALFENLPLDIIVKDPAQRILMMNPAIQKRLQVREADWIGKSYGSLYPDEPDDEEVAEQERRAFDRGETLTVERHRVGPDGAERTLLLHKFPILDGDGDLTAIGSVGIDLTELRLAQQKASRAERLLYDAVDSLPIAFALFDGDDRLILANEYARENTAWSSRLLTPGVTYEELVRDCAARGVPLNAREDPDGWVAERLRYHRRGEGDTENRMPDGRTMYAVERKTSDGGTISLRIDITDRKRAEDAVKRHLEELEQIVEERTRHLSQEIAERRHVEQSLRELNETLEERVDERTRELQAAKLRAEIANRAKTDFLRHMSHELRTPLNAVIGFSDMIGEQILGPIRDDRYLGYARDIHESGMFLLTLINEILDVARIEEGAVELENVALDLAAVVASCRKVVETRAAEKRIDLRTELSADAPHLIADERRIKQVVINLLSNAIKFTPDGGRVTVSVTRSAAGEPVLAVSDTGVGIAPDDLERVLEPFGRTASSLSSTVQGTGLGLPICRALVEAHGGRLELESVPGAGTTVYAVFPPDRLGGRGRAARGADAG